ncbi:hypothetical protein, partial [Saccharospirillum sp.]|uniref:hypothetical protein n=1 Tax=Saccharospirillum sp. TaxID=2033801 RepID=UPI0034A08F96
GVEVTKLGGVKGLIYWRLLFMRLAGIDLAWHGAKNPSAVAIALLDRKTLTVETIAPSLGGGYRGRGLSCIVA